jgi:hypothetical protein
MSLAIFKHLDDQTGEFLRRYLHGESLTDIAKSIGVTPSAITNRFKRRKISIYKGKIDQDIKDRICKDISSNLKDIKTISEEILIPIPRIQELFIRESHVRKGEIRYLSTLSCPKCGNNERYSADGKCVKCVASNRKARTKNNNWKESRNTNSGTINLKLIDSVEEKTKLVKETFLRHGLVVEEGWEFEKYDQYIPFKPTEGLYEGVLCQTTWKSFLKYKGVNLRSVLNPKKFIVEYCENNGRRVDKEYLEETFDYKIRSGRLKIRFSPITGSYKGVPMEQSWSRIIEGREYDRGCALDQTQAIKTAFLNKKRIVDDNWEFHSETEPVRFVPSFGLFDGLQCQQRISHVLNREDGIDWRSVLEKEELIKRLLPPGYRLLIPPPSSAKGTDKLSIECSEKHLWKPTISDFLSRESICGKCAARLKNPYGGSSKELFESNPDHASSASHLYIVKVQGINQVHNKIGIANDVLKRGNGRYVKIFYQRKSSRAVCWCVEQILKKRSLQYRSGYKDKDIDGWTGFRSLELDLQDYIAMADSLIDEVERVGWKIFYEEYAEEILVEAKGTRKRNKI